MQIFGSIPFGLPREGPKGPTRCHRGHCTVAQIAQTSDWVDGGFTAVVVAKHHRPDTVRRGPTADGCQACGRIQLGESASQLQVPRACKAQRVTRA